VTVLDDVLADLASQGQTPPCRHPDAQHHWTSTRRADRDHAIAACRTCPAMKPCLDTAVAYALTGRIWGGQDTTWTPARPASTRRQRPKGEFLLAQASG